MHNAEPFSTPFPIGFKPSSCQSLLSKVEKEDKSAVLHALVVGRLIFLGCAVGHIAQAMSSFVHDKS